MLIIVGTSIHALTMPEWLHSALPPTPLGIGVHRPQDGPLHGGTSPALACQELQLPPLTMPPLGSSCLPCLPSFLLQLQDKQCYWQGSLAPKGCRVGGNSWTEVEASSWWLQSPVSQGLSEESQANFCHPLYWPPPTHSPAPCCNAPKHPRQCKGHPPRGMEQGTYLPTARTMGTLGCYCPALPTQPQASCHLELPPKQRTAPPTLP